MKSRIWRLAGVGLLCVSVSAPALAEGPNSQEEQHAPQGQHNNAPQNHPQPQSRPQPQPQPQQQQPHVQQSGQYQFHQQDFNRQEPQRQQHQQEQQQRPPQQVQQPQRQENQPGRQYQFHQQDFPRPQEQNNQFQNNQFQNRPAQVIEQPSIRPKPDEVRQTQPPIRGNYADMPNRDRSGGNDPRGPRDDHRWPGRPDGHGNGWGAGPQYRPGQFVDRFPGQSYRVPYRGGDYFFSGGYWYQPQGPRYRVVAPPYGIRTRYLPDYAREVWVGGALLFLAAGSYYQYLDETQDYMVVNPPEAQPEPAPNPYDVNVYPAYGQSPEQVQQDKYECYRQAVQQTGFDPATATYAPEEAVVDGYRNALGSCLSTRGYRVY